MSLLYLVGYGTLLATCAVLLFAFNRAQGNVRTLAAELTSATEQNKAHERQLSHRSELDVAKDEFISTVSHELRTPLTSIRGALGLLSHGLLGSVDAKAQNLVRIALTNTDRLIRLINDILDLERMESGRAPLQIRRCSLRELAIQATETMSALADAADVRLELIPTTTTELFFDGDADRILQVLTNLLSNAIKFSPPHSSIRIAIHPHPGSLRITVADQGRGVPQGKLESIFERFQQVEPSDARQKGGTGLGLAICRSIVQQHGGHIWAQQHTGPGVSLCAEFPCAHRAPDSPRIPPIERAANRTSTVLVCEDDPHIRAIVSEHLRRQGYQVREAGRSEKLIEYAR